MNCSLILLAITKEILLILRNITEILLIEIVKIIN